MRLRTRLHPLSGSGGFSMVELLVVVALIVVAAAIALPNIAGYVKNAKVRGATNQVAGEIQTARNRAIKKNVSPSATGGVVFAILDENSYRFTVLDDNNAVRPPDPRLGLAPVRDLPGGVVFVPGSATPVFGMGFDSLGKLCKLGPPPNSPQCAPLQTVASMCADGDTHCSDRAAGNFIDNDPTDLFGNTLRIRIRETQSGVERTVSIQAGGKVQAQK